MEVIGAGVGILGVVAVAAFVVLLLIVRGSGEANEVAERQEAELLREIQDAEAYRRITSR